MRHGDGDGWVLCSAGHRHWGRYGAAGLLLSSGADVLLQHRVGWSHHGGTWGVPGGARAGGEDPVDAALREAREEAGVDPAAVLPAAVFVEDHGSWAYATVLAEATAPVSARPTDAESIDVAWVPAADVVERPLHPGFAAAWPDLDPLAGRRLRVVVDVANVMGSTPDGWWRDRAGAATRLLQTLPRLRAGLDAAAVDVPGSPTGLRTWLPDVVAVVEGQARATTASPDGVEVVRAPRSGDDAIVDEVRRHRSARPRDVLVVVTADRGLRARVEDLGASARSPRLLSP